jgi:plasmid stability protein
VEALKRRAAANGRSAEAEHRAILERALNAGREAFQTRAAQLREETRGRIHVESAQLIHEDRDSRRASSSTPPVAPKWMLSEADRKPTAGSSPRSRKRPS